MPVKAASPLHRAGRHPPGPPTERIKVITRAHCSGSLSAEWPEALAAHLEKEIGDALVATAGSQHQWSLPFRGRHIHADPRLKQEVHDGIVSNVGGIHQRGPATTILLIQI